MNATQLQKLIESVLREFGAHSPSAVDLLMLTAAQESHCGEYIRQIGGGPALGVFQMEPETILDIVKNYVSFRPDLGARIERFKTSMSPWLNLTGNMLYQIVMARVHYMRVPEKLPVFLGDEFYYIKSLAEYWKDHWNTPKGAGTVDQAIQNYNKYVRKPK